MAQQAAARIRCPDCRPDRDLNVEQIDGSVWTCMECGAIFDMDRPWRDRVIGKFHDRPNEEGVKVFASDFKQRKAKLPLTPPVEPVLGKMVIRQSILHPVS